MADIIFKANEFGFETGSKLKLSEKKVRFYPSAKGALSITLIFDLEDITNFIDGPNKIDDNGGTKEYGVFTRENIDHLVDGGTFSELTIAGDDDSESILLQSDNSDISFKTSGDKRNHGSGAFLTEL